MRTAILVVASALFGAGATALYYRRRTKRLRARIAALRDGKDPSDKGIETMKKVVWTCLINGFLWVWCSYLLAALGKEQIAESLSQVAVTSIIGVVLAYAVKSIFENLSKNNHWPDKTPALPEQEEPPEGGAG